ncbi:FecR family protein [Sphingomonas koreensis]
MTHSTREEERHDTAVTWFVRLQDCDDEEIWLKHRDWLEADRANAAAYDAVARLWIEAEALRELDDSPAPVAEIIDLSAYRPKRPIWWRWSVPAVAAAAVIAAVGLTQVERATAPISETFRTDAAAIRTITLRDGSRVTLNHSTIVTVQFAQRERVVELASGEAAFDVRHDAARPFAVLVEGRRIQVVGTEFNVLNAGGAFAVTVRRGLVSVSPRLANGETVRLPAGTALTHGPDARADRVVKVEADDAFAWTKGRLIYVDQPLNDVARDLGRYGGDVVTVAPELTRMRVSGVLTIEDSRSLDRQLELLLPIRIERAPAGRRIVPAR